MSGYRPEYRSRAYVATGAELDTLTRYFTDHFVPGQKFTEADLLAEPMLILDAMHYLTSYRGTFKYICDLRIKYTISDDGPSPTKAVLVSVLNCWLNDYRRSHGERTVPANAVAYPTIRNITMPSRLGMSMPVVIEGQAKTVKLHAAGPNSSNPECWYVTDGGKFGANQYFGRIEKGGEFVAVRDIDERWVPEITRVLTGLNEAGALLPPA